MDPRRRRFTEEEGTEAVPLEGGGNEPVVVVTAEPVATATRTVVGDLGGTGSRDQPAWHFREENL